MSVAGVCNVTAYWVAKEPAWFLDLLRKIFVRSNPLPPRDFGGFKLPRNPLDSRVDIYLRGSPGGGLRVNGIGDDSS